MTLMVIPCTGGRVLSLSLSFPALLTAGLMFLIVLIALSLVVKSAVESAVNASVIQSQSAENKVLTERIEAFDRDMKLVALRIDTLKALGQEAGKLTNLEETEEDVASSGSEASQAYGGGSDEEISTRLDLLLEQVAEHRGSHSGLLKDLEKRKFHADHTPSIRPCSGWVIAGYGHKENPFTGRVEMHRGVDIAAPRGTPIYATADGMVSFVGNKPGYGLTVVIDHGLRCSTWYGHCSMAKVAVGQPVKRGAVIGTIGKTGQAIGPHVQYEVRVDGEPVDPENFFLDSDKPVF